MKRLKYLVLLLLVVFLVSCNTKDMEQPVIEGTTNFEIEVGSASTIDYLQNVTATDNVDGNLTSSISVDSSKVDVNVVGSYDVSYTVTDAAGNKKEVTIKVNVVDKTKPVIAGHKDITYVIGSDMPNYLEGITATDNYDGSLTDAITVDDSGVDLFEAGTYELVYRVTDASGNVGEEKVNVVVEANPFAPVLTLLEQISVDQNTASIDYMKYISAYSKIEGDLTDIVTVDDSNVKLDTVGTYAVIYRVVDKSGNETKLTVTVKVRDTVAPVINGLATLTYNVHIDPAVIENYLRTSASFTATDNLEGNIKDRMNIDLSAVDLSVLGEYTLVLSVSDTSGNETVFNVKIIVRDATKPVISLPTTLFYFGETLDYLEGALAQDNYDGNITNKLIYNDENVNLDVPGVYTVIYTVTDESGNTATANGKVTVLESRELVDNLRTDVEALDIPSTPLAVRKYTFPSTGENGTQFSWSYLESQFVSTSGNFIRPGIHEEAEVIVRLRAQNGVYFEVFYFELTIAGLEEVEVSEKQTLIYEALGTEYVTEDSQIDTYFVTGGSVPYVGVEEFLALLEGAIAFDELVFEYEEDILTITYEVSGENEDGDEETYEMIAIFNFTENTFFIETYDFFAYYVESTTTDYGDGLNYEDVEGFDSVPKTFDLGAYGFDIILHEDGEEVLYLAPYYILNLLFTSDLYYDVYYNGDQYYGVDTNQFLDGGDVLETIKTSSFNTKAMPYDMKLFSYNYLVFAFDHFYGLKEGANVETYATKFNSFYDKMVEGNDYEHYRAVFELSYSLDELHTSHEITGFYEPASFEFTVALGDLGQRTQAYYRGYWTVQGQLDALYGNAAATPPIRYTPNGKTAIINISSFTVDTPDQFKRNIELLEEGVENVIVDISYNGGGNVGAVFRLFGYLTETPIKYHSQNPADGSKVTYTISSDYDAFEQYNFYIMISSVTFSAANLTASMAKEVGIPVIGQKSSGGASSIGMLQIPGGSVIRMSTNNVLSRREVLEDGTYVYHSIEYGVEPDYKLVSVTNLQLIQDFIESLG